MMRRVYVAWFTAALALVAVCSSATHKELPLDHSQEALASCATVALATGVHREDERQNGTGPIPLVACAPAFAAGQTFLAREIELEIERGPRGTHVERVFTKVAPRGDAGPDAARDAGPSSYD